MTHCHSEKTKENCPVCNEEPTETSKAIDRAMHALSQAGVEERLRDTFAAAALTGMLARSTFTGDCKEYAKAAYIYADAMIEERKKKDV